MNINILLVDDHTLIRKGLAELFKKRTGFKVIGEACDGYEAIEKTFLLKPDLILMDIHMPGLNGLDTLRRIKEKFPDIKVVMLTISDEDETLYEALQIGADGYLLKNVDPYNLFDLIKEIIQGKTAVSSTLAGKVLNNYVNNSLKNQNLDCFTESLSQREAEVLQLVAKGATNKEIAKKLVISENTVKNHIRRILEKLGSKNRAQAVAYALKKGWIKSPI